MREISNSTLVMLVVLAITISIFGTLISMTRLNQLSGLAEITGFASTASGTANLTVPASTSINLVDSNISLGTLGQGNRNTSDNVSDWWVVNNDGSVNISIYIYGTQNGLGALPNYKGRGPFVSALTTGGCFGDYYSQNMTCFMVKCNSTLSGENCNDTYYMLDNSSTDTVLLTHLASVNNLDNATFGVNASVPSDEPAGVKVQSVTFEAACSQVSGCS